MRPLSEEGVVVGVVGLPAPRTKQFRDPPARTLRAVTPYYTRTSDRRKEFVLGTKPSPIKGMRRNLDKKAWKQYETHQRRTSPLERAEYYAREMKERRLRSFRALSLLLGEPVNRVGRHMKLLRLPQPIKTFLREHHEPKYLRYFSERRLQELVGLGDSREVWRRFREMVRDADRKAGIWKDARA